MISSRTIPLRAFPRVFFFVIILILNIAFPYPGQMALAGDPPKTTQRVLQIGHRGAAGLAPENTLAAFRRGLEIGVDGLELDVLLTKDGVLVVHHDFRLRPEIARTPDGNWIGGLSGPAIKDLTLAELRTYDVGRLKPGTPYASRFPEQKPSDGERVPTLHEVISLLKERNDQKTQLWVEIKTSPEQPELTPSPETVVHETLKVLREGNALSKANILSFDWRPLVYVQKTAPELPTHYLSLVSNSLDNIKPGKPGPSPWTAGIDVDDFDGSIPRAVKAAGGRCWSPYYKSLTPALLEEAHRLGIKVFVWTPDSRADILRLIEMKVDGITTNRPDILKSVLQGQ